MWKLDEIRSSHKYSMKAVIPAGGLGTRMLPITKAVPKELIPIEGKPAIQWVLEEAAEAGVREFVIVTSPAKNALRNYLTPLQGADPLLRHRGLDSLETLLRSLNLSFIDQPEPRGLGDALLRCREAIGDRYFALLLPDNIFRGCAVLRRIVEAHERTGRSCLALRQAEGSALSDGAVLAELTNDYTCEIRRVLPKGSDAGERTRLRPIGRAILSPQAFEFLGAAGASTELDDVPALDGLARTGELIGVLTEEPFVHLGSGSSAGSAHLDQ